MITTRHMQLEVELVRWALLIIAAIALVLAAATMAAADPMMEPRLLPGDMDKIAEPIPNVPMQPFFPEEAPGRRFPPAEAAARVWLILEQHKAGHTLEAIAGWKQLRLPKETEHWREMAMGVAYLQTGDLQQAMAYLEAAGQRMPENPVVNYYVGLLRLEQAAAAVRVPDGLYGGRDRLVAYTPQENKTVYEMLALAELRKAFAGANAVRHDERLLGADDAIEEAFVVPRVGDLLAALGAHNFAGKACLVMFGLHLDRGELIEAELNLDRAAATGLPTLYGYRELADTYLDRGCQADGLRAVRKDLRVNYPWFARVCERLAELAHDNTGRMWVW